VVVDEVPSHCKHLLVDFLVRPELRYRAACDCLENARGQLREDIVRVILAKREVDVVSGNHIVVECAQLLQVLPLLFVRVALHSFVAKAIPQRHQLNHVLRCFLEHDQAVDVPGVEPDSIVAVVHELGQELQADQHNLIVIIECIQRTFYDHTQVLRVEPVKEDVEIFGLIQTPEHSSEHVEDLGDLSFRAWRAF